MMTFILEDSVRFNHPKNTWEFFSTYLGIWKACTVVTARDCFDDCGFVYVKGIS